MKRDIEVEAMEGMSCKQVRITNNITNTLIAEHHMCLDCAIGTAVAHLREGDPRKAPSPPAPAIVVPLDR